MSKLVLAVVFLGFAAVWAISLGVQPRSEAAAAKGPKIVHSVYFALKDNSPQAKQKLVAACQKYLTKHPGEVYFAAGVLAEELNRPVNDRDFDVNLVIVFEDKKAHDLYQDADRHNKFIEENKENWKKVRVFDSAAE